MNVQNRHTKFMYKMRSECKHFLLSTVNVNTFFLVKQWMQTLKRYLLQIWMTIATVFFLVITIATVLMALIVDSFWPRAGPFVIFFFNFVPGYKYSKQNRLVFKPNQAGPLTQCVYVVQRLLYFWTKKKNFFFDTEKTYFFLDKTKNLL